MIATCPYEFLPQKMIAIGHHGPMAQKMIANYLYEFLPQKMIAIGHHGPLAQKMIATCPYEFLAQKMIANYLYELLAQKMIAIGILIQRIKYIVLQGFEASLDDGLSVILYDTSGKDDVNINDLILKTVSVEAESSLLVASQTVSPADSLSSIPDKVKPDSAKSSQQSSPALPRKNLSSLKPSSKDSTPKASPGSSCIGKDEKSVILKENLSSKTSTVSRQTEKTQKLTSNTVKTFETKKPASKVSAKFVQAQDDTEEGSDSWETESEEEFVEQEYEEEEDKTDHNSNLKFTSIDEICDSIDSKCKIITKSPSPQPSSDVTSLYTWNKNDKDGTSHNDNEEYDDSELWIPKEYHKLPLPDVYSVPPVGEFCDIHVSFVFDPTNFVCNPYESLAELNDLHQEMYHYFNTYHTDKVGEQNGLWYRIIVNKIINPGLVSVYNVDYGEYNAMTLDEIKPLPWRFWKLPQQAFKGKLIDIQPAGGAQVWSEAAKYKMTQMAQDRNLVGLVCGIDETGVVSLKLVDTLSEEDVCLHEVLLEMGYAELIATPHPHGHE
ncbi:hypothetical protein KUTeg_015694 [Tegillarca granosa]|uniref:Tudor domain-containing protein n=1 Tax=Tegillarca granosa TaxID=220873 RepID=A0ABQ9ENB4_TEGGR|nr:hypothetical protein KUTeg_015694 [Tegillarca granosa]